MVPSNSAKKLSVKYGNPSSVKHSKVESKVTKKSRQNLQFKIKRYSTEGINIPNEQNEIFSGLIKGGRNIKPTIKIEHDSSNIANLLQIIKEKDEIIKKLMKRNNELEDMLSQCKMKYQKNETSRNPIAIMPIAQLLERTTSQKLNLEQFRHREDFGYCVQKKELSHRISRAGNATLSLHGKNNMATFRPLSLKSISLSLSL